MKKILNIFGLFFLVISSCNSPENELNGYWREYLNTEKDFYHSYHINDSSIFIDHISIGYENLNEYENGRIVIPFNDLGEWTANYKIEKNNLFVNDTVRWIRMNYTDSLFLEDISGILMVKVLPEFCDSLTNYLEYECTNANYIPIGKIKNSFKEKALLNNVYNFNGYFIQLNDVLGNIEELHEFIYHCDTLILNADKDVPKEFIELLFNESLKYNPNMKLFRTFVDIENRKLKIKRIFS